MPHPKNHNKTKKSKKHIATILLAILPILLIVCLSNLQFFNYKLRTTPATDIETPNREIIEEAALTKQARRAEKVAAEQAQRGAVADKNRLISEINTHIEELHQEVTQLVTSNTIEKTQRDAENLLNTKQEEKRVVEEQTHQIEKVASEQERVATIANVNRRIMEINMRLDELHQEAIQLVPDNATVEAAAKAKADAEIVLKAKEEQRETEEQARRAKEEAAEQARITAVVDTNKRITEINMRLSELHQLQEIIQLISNGATMEEATKAKTDAETLLRAKEERIEAEERARRAAEITVQTQVGVITSVLGALGIIH